MITSEELRVAALAASAKRGKRVAKRRIFRRWLGWVAWSIVLPVLGLLTLIFVLTSLAFWQYMGHDAAYTAAQKWVQQEFGSFKNSAITESAHSISPSFSSSTNCNENDSMIN